ncbi:FtsK/SpoIIIE family DNA translocase [Faecalimonas sp.]
MAAKSNKSKKAAKRTPVKKKTKKQTKKKTVQQNTFLKNEIFILFSLTICILLLISNFGIGGFLGDIVSSFLFGTFGLMAYIIPILLFIGIAFITSNKGNSVAYIKLGAGIVLTVLSCTFIQLLTGDYNSKSTLLSYYHVSSLDKQGGGVVGGIFSELLCHFFGVVGAYIIVIILSIICFIVITEKSFLRSVKQGGEKAYETAKADVQRRREQSVVRKEEKRQNKELQRKDKHVKGVSFDTTLMPKELDEDIKEIFPEETPPLYSEEILESPFHEDVIEPIPETMVIHRAEEKKQSKKKKDKEKEKEEISNEVEEVAEIIEKECSKSNSEYIFPPLQLLKNGKRSNGDSDTYLRETAIKLQQTLKNFGVNVTVTNVSCGPSVTRFELQPEQGVKVSKIVGLSDDIKLNLAAADIRIEAPIPGKAAVGIEVPNRENTAVMLRDLLETKEFQSHPSNIAFAAGKDIAGKVVVADIKKMPHVLIAGATGSGKSVCINTLIMSILYKARPDEVKLIMIDPKVVELSVYNGIPHLMIPVVTDPKKASGALNWAVVEMEKRYQLFAEYNVRDLNGYNDKVEQIKDLEDETKPEKLPQLVIIVDELADLMMVAPGEVETAICRLAQLARAAGIHLVLATQRPSVNVITGLIKANMPSRIAFSVSSGVDSRTIIDMNGAEKLLGKGDMLFYPSGYQKPVRVQGSFVSDKEVQAVVDFLVSKNGNVSYDEEITKQVDSASNMGANLSSAGNSGNEKDVYFVDAGRFVIEKEKASIGMLQRVFKIGFNRAARIMDQLFEAGVVGEEEGTKPRKVLMSMEQFEQYIEETV